MPSKKIQILNIEGQPLEGAHIIPDNGTPSITNMYGEAQVIASTNQEFVQISHVAGKTQVMPYYDLPETLTLGQNQLDEVVINAPGKKNNTPYWIAGGILVGVLLYKNQNQAKKIIL